ncbi:MAG: stage III sporulation protein AD [Lachnospiraceae bacterium]|nr:stage III sporulation protein AD [Lachnospiraceae bacterium]
MTVIKLCFLAILGVMMSLMLKSERGGLGLLLTFAIGFMIFGFGVLRLRDLLERMTWLGGYLGEGSRYLMILLRTMGITYICDFSSGICRDAGHGFLAGQLETLGKLMIMGSGLSILLAVMEQIRDFA